LLSVQNLKEEESSGCTEVHRVPGEPGGADLHKLLQEKNEKQKNMVSALVEQNQLLQERVVELETITKEHGHAALVKRVDVHEQKLDALAESIEQIKSALAAWALKD
jgi:hypothetical protein